MKLPVPHLTATIAPPGPGPHARGQVTIHGYTPMQRGDEDRTNTGYRCTRCTSVGRDGSGHSSRNARCPSRLTPVPERKSVVTTRSRCAARYSHLVGCSLREAASTFGVTVTAARLGWAALYAGIPTDPAQRGPR